MRNNLFSLLHRRYMRAPERVAIDTPGRTPLSFAELDDLAARIARALADGGLVAGDRVVVQVDKSPEALCVYLACLRAGFIYLPLNTAYRPAELEYFLDDASPRAVVCRPEACEIMEGLAARRGAGQVYTLDDAGGGTLCRSARGLASMPVADLDGDAVAAILYTSGTTGRPKGAMLTHRNLSANALALHQAWGWREGDVLLHALPLFHIHGLFVACHCALLNASTMIALPRFDADSVLDALPRATVFMGVPTFYTRLLANPRLDAGRCRGMRLFTCGSAPLLEQTFEAFHARTGHAILERYGMTETGMNTSNPLDGPRRPGTVGPPLPGVSVRVVDDSGAEAPTGTIGVLQVRGDNVFAGYWNKPDANAESFASDGWFITGDLARIEPDGYVAIVGRAKDMIISGGYNVYPKEIEGRIDEISGVVESSVIGIPDADFGEAVTAVVVRASGREDLTEQSVIAALKEVVANYKIPKRVHFVDELPRNAMGKVQKNVLRERYSQGRDGGLRTEC
jgi:malonyl-CoA/methylmalonyl-CoA synthetase